MACEHRPGCALQRFGTVGRRAGEVAVRTSRHLHARMCALLEQKESTLLSARNDSMGHAGFAGARRRTPGNWLDEWTIRSSSRRIAATR